MTRFLTFLMMPQRGTWSDIPTLKALACEDSGTIRLAAFTSFGSSRRRTVFRWLEKLAPRSLGEETTPNGILARVRWSGFPCSGIGSVLIHSEFPSRAQLLHEYLKGLLRHYHDMATTVCVVVS
jgi:hypothetical protein